MMKQTLKFLLLISIAALLAGCKLAVIVVEGGTVREGDGGGNVCDVGTICMFDVVNTESTYIFRALPSERWVFDHWQAGDRFLCGGSKEYQCRISLDQLEDEVAEKIVNSTMTAYLMPIFRPAKDIIRVDGKEWYQPDLFSNLSWNEINAICPEGVCNGTLNGHDMTGWTWASLKDINDLFNYYLGSELLGPGPDRVELAPDAGSNIFEDGWLPTVKVFFDPYGYQRWIKGWTRNGLNTNPNQAWPGSWEQFDPFYSEIQTDESYAKDHSWVLDGAWFFRLPE